MKTALFTAILLLIFNLSFGQGEQKSAELSFPRNYISLNPLNILLFQQAGITYEYKPGKFGYGLTAGYIYPNHKEYSNYFIAGPTNSGSLGDYSGWFLVPQVNMYLNKPKNQGHANLFYVSLKPVYKHMNLDSSQTTAWSHPDDYYVYRKMIDNVDVYGGFAGIGYKYYLHHFFFNLEFGLGILTVNHRMTISYERISSYPNYYYPPKEESTHEIHGTVNFTVTIGGAL